MSEKRKDPEDGQAYTFEEISAYYKGTYKKKEIAAYWAEMKPVKGKAKAKAAPEPKAKAKAKAKAKVKAKAKAKAKEPKVTGKGDAFPKITVYKGFEKFDITAEIAEKKVIITGAPGAFTPTCQNEHIPNYMKHEDALKAKGIDEIFVMSCNDGAVMDGWKKTCGVKDGSIMTFIGDPYLRCTKKLGVVLRVDKLKQMGLGERCKRFTMVVDKGTVTYVSIAEPDGDASVTYAEATLAALE
jgi:peroxiredoxin